MYDMYFRVCLGFGGNIFFLLPNKIEFDFVN